MKTAIVSRTFAAAALALAAGLLAAPASFAAETAANAPSGAKAAPGAKLGPLAKRGLYLVSTAGCHDCHTPGWSENGGQAPKDMLLVGSGTNFQGPWGTTYPPNLRLYVQRVPRDDEYIAKLETACLEMEADVQSILSTIQQKAA